MSLMMSFFMSFVLTWVNLGMIDNFISFWMRAFGSAIIVAFPSSLMVLPLVGKIVNFFVEE